MAQQLPVQLTQIVNLGDTGVKSASFRFGNVAVDGDKHLVVRDVESNELYFVSLNPKEALESPGSPGAYSVTKKPTQAEAALHHPTDPIVALRAKADGGQQVVQVLNLETKARMGTAPMSESIVYWRWVAPRVLALVTDKAVWHWTLAEGTDAGEPQKICEREGRLAEGVQIIGYSTDKEMKWCVLTGISTQDGGKTIDGSLQLYSMELKKHQQLEGHAACFGGLVVDEALGPQPVICFAEKKRGSPEFKLHVRDLAPKREDGKPPLRVCTDIALSPDAPSDFPLAVHLSKKLGLVFLVTKGGFLLLFDAFTGTQLLRHRISQDPVFLTADSPQTGGVITVHKKGVVALTTVNVGLLGPYMQHGLPHLPNRAQIYLSLAKRYGLPGADDALVQAFTQHFASGDYRGAARICATLKSGRLRTPQVLQQFKGVPAQPGQTSAILLYFSTLLEYGSLNAVESLELVRPVVAQGRKDFVTTWLREDKLECTEELGDVLRPLDPALATQVYKKAKAGQKVMLMLVEQGKTDELLEYAAQTRMQADYSALLRSMLATNPEGAVAFAQKLLATEPPLVDPNQVVDVLLQQQRFQELSSLLLEYLKGNKPEQGPLQTRLFEINLKHSPQVAEAIFQMEMLTHYDRQKVGALCEAAGLYQRALENYTELTDVKRVLLQTGGKISQEWMAQFFGRMAPEVCVEILTDMLRASSQNLQAVVGVAIKFHEQLGTERLIAMFERFSSYEGIFYFLGSILAFSTDPEVHFKYIEAAAKLNHTQEVERVCRESKHYEPQRVKEFLKQAKLSDPRPLIYVCDLHGFVVELTEYLYKHSLLRYIEVYVSRVNAANAPLVVGALVDLDAPEDFIKQLLQAVRGNCSASQLVEEVEKRNRLRLLLQWLEQRVAEGNQDPAVHNALAKIFIDTNRDAENFLKTNAFYDSMEVGKYCEERDPHLAFIAYKRAWGPCDTQLVELTNKNGLFRLQARYLVERQCAELWAYVLRPENNYRRSVIDQVVSSALPESSSADEVSAAVNAFISAQLPQELTELLEKIVLHNSDFSSNQNLQNLLILTAIKAEPSRVMGYINRLQNFDGAAIAQVALENGLREEALTIYRKFGLLAEAADTLLEAAAGGGEQELERAQEFAQRCGNAEVWRKLGRAQLRQGRVVEAVDSLIKANDGEVFREVVEKATEQGAFEALAEYLLMARKSVTIKDQTLDSELLYSYAMTERLDDLEMFLNGPNTANVQAVGDRLFDQGRYQAAKILYQSLPNYSKLASCFVRMKDFGAAVDAARKAKNPKTWKEVAFGALNEGDIKCAHTAGLQLIAHPDLLDALVEEYERWGLHKQLMELLETGAQGERTHVGLFTELGVLYATYDSAKLMDHCKQHKARMNIPRLIRTCENCCLWKEAVYLHTIYDEYEQAANCMILHPTAWQHDQFIQVVQKVSNVELLYRAISFYLEEHPLQLCALLKGMDRKVDHSRVVQQLRKAGHLPLIEKYLQEQLPLNVAAVNEAMLELLVEAQDEERIRELITECDNFDQLGLAKQLEGHNELGMRRIAALLYQKNKKYSLAIELSKKDAQLQDCIETAKESGSAQLVEDLLKYFLTDLKDPEAFAACLHSCCDLVKPDVALELAWRHKVVDFIMPYLIHVVRDVNTRLDQLGKQQQQQQQLQQSAPNDYVPDYSMQPMTMLPGMGGLALMPPAPNCTPSHQTFGQFSETMVLFGSCKHPSSVGTPASVAISAGLLSELMEGPAEGRSLD
ncbi:clathrin heavy chain, putative [Eimeria brunetti]|uniref:Clathrin heavy chain n=1 Tax=Eimeria brunetti TaxID=51314 RepID=U6LHM3_9EIME|nr:clathrin heavy chain, putative [Eimeria brunetti]